MTILETMLKKLTDNYNKNLLGNIGKLFRIVADELEEVKVTLDTMETFRDIDQASGVTLDRIGRNVLQARSQLPDPQFREMIKTKIRANLSPGDIDTVADIAEVFVGENLAGVQEMWMVTDHPEAGEPAALLVRINKYDDLNRIPFAAIKRVAAGGVHVYFQVLDAITEESGWQEDLTLISYACPVPSDSLYPQNNLFPC